MSVTELKSENFESEVNNSEIPVLIDFWATWCGPCKMMTPVVEELATEKEGTIKVCKVNVDDEPDLAQKFNIMSIPTFVAIKEGKVVGTSVGVQTKQQILELF
ncbi:MAG: thioredoxin [Clostridia bacterium]|jgi:thioredoxin|nr:thioredoxin [Clostridium sp. CAG:798]HBJ12285.1 thioredoxin [Clostridiales bacterium]